MNNERKTLNKSLFMDDDDAEYSGVEAATAAAAAASAGHCQRPDHALFPRCTSFFQTTTTDTAILA